MKEVLSQQGISYTEYNVLEDRQALEEMVRISGMRCVPVVAAQGEVIVGFDPARLAGLVKRLKEAPKLG